MPTDPFLQRLRAELPQWVQRGWVAPQHSELILDHVAHRAPGAPRHIAAFGLLGALLLGAGVIMFFAANWGALPKLGKLAVLGGALGASYTAAGACRARGLAVSAQGLLLLGVVLFGASIFLIAQIYHIDAHYPDGVLLWAAGALAAAWLGQSQPALIAALVLALLWSGIETFAFERNPHWRFFLPLLAALALVYARRWLVALRVAGWALLLWCALVLVADEFLARTWTGERLALLQIYVFAGIALYIVGRGLETFARAAPYARAAVMTGAVGAAAALFALSFPEVHRFGRVETFAALLSPAWLVATAALLVLVAALMAWRYHDTPLGSLPLYRKGAFVWLVLAAALAVAGLLTHGEFGGWAALGYNLLAFAGAIWMVLTGVDRGERRIVNLGIACFGTLILARYVDTFWSLLDRSYFFMVGGALLLAAGVMLERARRRLTARIVAPAVSA